MILIFKLLSVVVSFSLMLIPRCSLHVMYISTPSVSAFIACRMFKISDTQRSVVAERYYLVSTRHRAFDVVVVQSFLLVIYALRETL